MGICFSKKEKKAQAPGPSSPAHEKKQSQTHKPALAAQRQKRPERVADVEGGLESKPAFLVTPTKNKKRPTNQRDDEAQAEVAPVADVLPGLPGKGVTRRDGGLAVVEEARLPPVRTSSCTKEEVESILIQCGRLSRSSSGKGVNEGAGNGGRKCSGTNRSYDFDNERKDEVEGELEKGPSSSRPSPRRRASSRDRDGGGDRSRRSDSRERGCGGDGGRRNSRSPGRRSEGLVTNSNSSIDRSRQPGKMVSVPARDKGNNGSSNTVAEDGRVNRRRAPSPSPAAGGGVRSSSPRSRSPAIVRVANENSHPSQQPPQSLSRSSSKKAEHSPYRRNPMAEIDDNPLRAEQPPSRSNSVENQKAPRTEVTRKVSSHSQPQKTRPEHGNGGGSEVPMVSNSSNPIKRGTREQRRRRREPEIVEDIVQPKEAPPNSNAEVIEASGTRMVSRTRSSRRSSRDLDALVGFNPETHLNPNSHTSLLLDDINNYHPQAAGFSLPACVSKACSILDALADLNSSSSDDKKELSTCPRDAPVDSDIATRNERKYLSARDKLRLEIEKTGGEAVPEESAGSNSFAGQPLSSTREPNSVDSGDGCWTSSWSNTAGEEAEASDHLSAFTDDHLPPTQTKHEGLLQAAHELEARRRQRTAASMSNCSLAAASSSSSRRREPDYRQARRGLGGSGAAGGTTRANANPAASVGSS